MTQKTENSASNYPFGPHWRTACKLSDNLLIMCSTENGVVRYSPLIVFSFRLISPVGVKRIVQFNTTYMRYEDIKSISDRIRWCRLRMGLKQEEAAKVLGLSRSQYFDYENGRKQCFTKEAADRLASFFGIPVTDLLDDYSRFIYEGQGRAVKECRNKLGLSKKAFARLIGTDHETISK